MSCLSRTCPVLTRFSPNEMYQWSKPSLRPASQSFSSGSIVLLVADAFVNIVPTHPLDIGVSSGSEFDTLYIIVCLDKDYNNNEMSLSKLLLPVSSPAFFSLLLRLQLLILSPQLFDHSLASISLRVSDAAHRCRSRLTASVSGFAPASIIPTQIDNCCLSRPRCQYVICPCLVSS